MNIVNLRNADTPEKFDDQPNYFGSMLGLSKMFGAQKLGFHLEVLDPKNFSCPYHYHEQEEELFVVIEGEAIVRCNGEYRKITAGDLVFYPVGADHVHAMYNHTDKPFRFLALSNVSTERDVCHYPDSGKLTTERGIEQNGEVVPYFMDEEDPAKYWSEQALRGEV